MGIFGLALLLFGLMVVAQGKLCSDASKNICPSAGVDEINFSSCGLVDADMADVSACLTEVGRSTIETIRLSSNELTTLPAGLFEGMTAMEELILHSNKFTTLPEDIFAGLTSLTDLALDGNLLTTLPGGLFAGLTAMEELVMYENELTSLPEDIFADLTSLTILYLEYNTLTTLPEGIFAGLTAIYEINLEENMLTTLPVDIFAGLASLDNLYLNDNELTTLPAGLFSGLTSISSLYLDSTVECVPDNIETANPPDAICGCTLEDNVLCDAGMVCSPGANDVTPGYTCGVDPDAGTGGDPHMIGLSGQKIDWKGEDGGWYALLSDTEAELTMSVRLTAPLPVDFPSRQLMTGLAVKYEGGHSVVIEIKDPYTTETDGCPREIHAPCLSEGALRVTVDGEEQLAVPAENARLARSAVMTASNLPAECRPYGSDVIWADTFANMANGRKLAGKQSLDEWVLGWSATAAAPAWCERFLAEFGAEGLLDHQTKHTVFKIETSHLTVRLHSGTNHQGGEVLDDGRILPQLEFWQMDVHIEHFDLNTDIVAGILGETARPVLDRADQPVMSGTKALRGDVEDYRISGPLMSDFHGFHDKN